jgi:hypothetical protein
MLHNESRSQIANKCVYRRQNYHLIRRLRNRRMGLRGARVSHLRKLRSAAALAVGVNYICIANMCAATHTQHRTETEGAKLLRSGVCRCASPVKSLAPRTHRATGTNSGSALKAIACRKNLLEWISISADKVQKSGAAVEFHLLLKAFAFILVALMPQQIQIFSGSAVDARVPPAEKSRA